MVVCMESANDDKTGRAEGGIELRCVVNVAYVSSSVFQECILIELQPVLIRLRRLPCDAL